MKPFERLFNRLDNKKIDKTPNLNIVMLFAAKEIGVPYSKYCLDYKLLVEGNIVCAEKYGLDCVTTMSDSMREVSGLGGKVLYPDDDVPYNEEFLIKGRNDLNKLHPIQPCDSERMTDSIKAIEAYKQRLCDDYPIIGWVEGCMAEAADLYGVNNLLVDLIDEPDFILDLMEVCLEQEILFAKEQIKAGADIIGVGDAIASVAGPNLYRQLALPFEIKLLKAIKDMGAKTKLHICGNITPFLELIPSDYCDIIDIDWMVPLERAVELHGNKSCICGNYDPVAILLMSDENKVREAAAHCAEIGGDRYISSAGCEVPKYTPQRNLQVINELLLCSTP